MWKTRDWKKNPKKKWRRSLGIALVLLTIPAAMFSGAFCGINEIAYSQTFATGTMIDDIDFGGMSYDQASTLILAREQAKLDAIVIPLEYNGTRIELGALALGISTSTQQVLDKAYYYGKGGTLIENFDRTILPQSYTTQLCIDEDTLCDNISAFLRVYNIAPQDAKASLDTKSRTFSYTSEKSGIQADAEAVYEQVINKIKHEDFSTLNVNDGFAKTVYPEITTDELKHNTALIGQCITQASNYPDRNTNIRLMCEAVNGIILQPGEILSLNDLAGERTLEKGFTMAPSIIDGQLVDSVGGGICQLAGTLYNAALLANMEIVERVRHTWPSEYLPVGLDATLNWDNKDLKLRNISDHAMYFVADFSGLKVTVEIYGQPLPDGVEIEIENHIIKEIPAVSPVVVCTNNLPAGERRIRVKSRKGYEVEVYRHYVQNGEIICNELISYDYYRPVQGSVLIGTDDEIK